MKSSDKGDNRFVVWLSDDYSLPGFFIGSYFFGRTFAPIRTKTSVCGALAHREEDAHVCASSDQQIPSGMFQTFETLRTGSDGLLAGNLSIDKLLISAKKRHGVRCGKMSS